MLLKVSVHSYSLGSDHRTQLPVSGGKVRGVCETTAVAAAVANGKGEGAMHMSRTSSMYTQHACRMTILSGHTGTKNAASKV